MYTVRQKTCDKTFAVKIFSDSMGIVKIKCTKIKHSINANAVQGYLSKNYFFITKYF